MTCGSWWEGVEGSRAFRGPLPPLPLPPPPPFGQLKIASHARSHNCYVPLSPPSHPSWTELLDAATASWPTPLILHSVPRGKLQWPPHDRSAARARADATATLSRFPWSHLPPHKSSLTVAQHTVRRAVSLQVSLGSHLLHPLTDLLSPPGHHATSPLTSWLRVPLAWYHSTTYSFFPDEAPRAIRRVYTSPTAPHAKRHFCGFCGSPLSYWSEAPREEADFISLALGSLASEDLDDLEERGLVPAEAATADEAQRQQQQQQAEREQEGGGTLVSSGEGATTVPWFETLVQGSRLGRMRRTRKGGAQSRDGSVTVEWEIVEWDDGGSGGSSVDGNGKRKLGDVDASEKDTEMKAS